jgi:DNA adenine methylase
MKYMGSKARYAKDILPIMLKDRKPDQYWVEPFVGGGNIIDKVDGKRLGSDINKYVIDALISIRDYVEELPKTNLEFTEQDYKKLRLDDSYKHKGYAGFAISYGGKWLGGWRRCSKGIDYVKGSYNSAMRQSIKLQGIELVHSSYLDLAIPKNSIIYCDPPYKNTTNYKHKFDHDIFWEWCRNKSVEGHTIYVSEYNAPNDFECVWEKEVYYYLNKTDSQYSKSTEKLFKPT